MAWPRRFIESTTKITAEMFRALVMTKEPRCAPLGIDTGDAGLGDRIHLGQGWYLILDARLPDVVSAVFWSRHDSFNSLGTEVMRAADLGQLRPADDFHLIAGKNVQLKVGDFWGSVHPSELGCSETFDLAGQRLCRGLTYHKSVRQYFFDADQSIEPHDRRRSNRLKYHPEVLPLLVMFRPGQETELTMMMTTETETVLGENLEPAASSLLDSFAQLLADAGVWTRLPGGEQARADFVDGEAGGWWWPADGQTLAEGLVASWLAGITAAVGELGLILDVDTLRDPHDPNSSGYTITINGEEIVLFNFVEDEPGVPSSYDPWRDCTLLPVKAINRLLIAGGHRHRLAVLDTGDDLVVMLLTDTEASQLAATSTDSVSVPT